MFKAQEKEYELLKKDITDIKKYINDYIGYIIGTNGVAFGLFAYLSLDKGSSFDAKFISLFLGLSILFFLYSIVIYKFNSHNKLAGYIRLLTQEVDYIDLNKKDNTCVCSDVNFQGSFLSWEFVMSRWDSLIVRNNCPRKTFESLQFYFQPQNFELDLDTAKTKDELKFEFFNKKKKSLKKKRCDFMCKLIFLNYQKLDSLISVFKPQKKIYSKYHISSWKYPKVIFLIFTVLYSFFLFSLIAILILPYYGYLKPFKPSSFHFLVYFIPIVISLLMYFLFFFKEYIRVLRKDKSVDFYCWAFLPFRVKLLNQYDFEPIYYATFYARYNGAIKHLKKIKKLLNENKDLIEVLKKDTEFHEKLNSKQNRKIQMKNTLSDFDYEELKIQIENGSNLKSNSIGKILMKYSKHIKTI